MPPEPESDLPWLAFRYVAGELAGDETAAFERRLDEDQGAREAVAEAVELAGAVALLAPDVLTLPRPGEPSRRRPLGQALGWMATGAAACLAAVVGLRALAPPAPVPAPLIGAEGPSAAQVAEPAVGAEVALAWSGLRREDRGPGQAELMAWLDAPTPGEADGTAPAEPAATAEEAPPSWMLEAASLGHAPGPGGPQTRGD
jgi:hypothetical protein